jgi:HAE1 family hydrophobic/amphiphilic exporter-1
MLKRFIDNPVLSTVISIIIVILGLLGLYSLPISQYPDIAPPAVEVSTTYQGASADVVMKSVIVPLEEEINGVENMTYMTSKASNDGTANITINFKQGTDPDLAAINVQNRITKATSLMPAEVIKMGITTSKRLNSEVFSFLLYSADGKYDQRFLDNYLRINIIPQIKRVQGVGDAQVYGNKDYSMRIWLRPDAMAAYGLIPSDVLAALAEQNIEAAPGKVGENSNQSFQYTLKYTGRLEKPEQFGEIILKSAGSGQVLKLKDVASIDLGSFTYSSTLTAQGHESPYVAINQTAGSNAHEIIKHCEKILSDASATFPKGIKYNVFTNANEFLDASISKLVSTIIEAFILVFIVVFIFLQDFRSTLIPAIAVPVAIIGTFFFLKLFGFTINLLTLFALVLAIGIVVDDAIVVVEAVHAKLDQGAKSAKKATLHAMSEISTAIISITLIMASVFIPVTFVTGSVGVFYKQFGLTLAVAILISAVNALTLSPALCALLLKPHEAHVEPKKGFMQRFYAGFNAAFNRMTSRYKQAVIFLMKRKWLAFAGIVIFGLVFWFLVKTTPTGFVPNEDSGSIYGNVILPPASSLERTEKISNQIDSIARSIPEVELSSRLAGMDLMSGTGSSYAAIFIRLKPWKQRTKKGQDIQSIVAQLFAKTAAIKGASIIFFAAPTLQGFGNNDGFEFKLQDKTGGNYQAFNQVIGGFMGALNQRPEVMYAATSYNTGFPQYEVRVNVAKCKEAGIAVNTVLNTLQGYLGGIYASDFNRFGKQYKVMIQAEASQRMNKEAIARIFVRNAKGTMAPISEFIELKKIYGPEFINRFNLFTAASVNGAPKQGYSSGDAIKAIQEVAAKTLPQGYTFEFSGLTLEEISSGSQTLLIFILSLLFIYFLLSAQYKSYILPLSVLLSLPIGLAGAFLFARAFGLDNNIFLQISLIMLIGLLAKNAILIVEFALMSRLSGKGLVESAIAGAVARLRPILMTSFAFIFGLLPLMFASGAGAISNRSIGTAAVGGMLIGTLFGVFVIPVLFVVFQGLQEKISGSKKTELSEEIKTENLEFQHLN